MSAAIIRTACSAAILSAIKEAVHGGRAFVLTQDAWQAADMHLSSIEPFAEDEYRVLVMLSCIQDQTGRIAAVNYERDGVPTTTFIRPLTWTVERLRGHIATLWLDVGDELGEMGEVVTEGRLVHVRSTLEMHCEAR